MRLLLHSLQLLCIRKVVFTGDSWSCLNRMFLTCCTPTHSPLWGQWDCCFLSSHMDCLYYSFHLYIYVYSTVRTLLPWQVLLFNWQLRLSVYKYFSTLSYRTKNVFKLFTIAKVPKYRNLVMSVNLSLQKQVKNLISKLVALCSRSNPCLSVIFQMILKMPPSTKLRKYKP